MSVLMAQPAYAEGLLRGAAPSTFAHLRILALWGGPTAMPGARERFALRSGPAGPRTRRSACCWASPRRGVVWAECTQPGADPEQSFGHHTYPDLELLEVLDGDGRSLGENEPGELVYSSLDWRGSVLLGTARGSWPAGG